MPLRDHFHSPWREQNLWEGFHSAWANTIVRYLNGSLLSRRYRAVPQVHLGAFVEADVATFERDEEGVSGKADANGANTGTALWSPPEPVETLVVDFPSQDLYEVRVYDDSRGMVLVGVIELVSPANKDRPENRCSFAAKCASYLQQQVGVLLVDVITDRKANFHEELLRLLALDSPKTDLPDLYAIAYRTYKNNGHWNLDAWPAPLAVGEPLPTLPLWLAGIIPVPLDLEKTYEETCQVLRIQ